MKGKINKSNIVLIILLGFFIILSGIFIYLYKTGFTKATASQMNREYTMEASRYSDIFKESEADVINYMWNKTDVDFMPQVVLDEMFKACFPRFSEDGQASLYSIYYMNWNNLANMYQAALDTPRYQYLLESFCDDHPDDDINNPNIYRQIPNISLRTIIEEMNINHVYVYQNGDTYFEAVKDHSWFLETYYDILTDELREFVSLDVLTTNIVSEDRTSIRFDILEEIILRDIEFIETAKSEELKDSALQTLRMALKMYLNCNQTYMLYGDYTDYKLDDDVFEVYDKFIETHSNQKVTELVIAARDAFKNDGGKGEPIDEEVADLVDNWLVDNKFGTAARIKEIADAYDDYTSLAVIPGTEGDEYDDGYLDDESITKYDATDYSLDDVLDEYGYEEDNYEDQITEDILED